VTVLPVYALKRSDRCDVCGAQALVEASFITGRLLFCGHHFARHEEGLRQQAFDINDQRPTPDGRTLR
jgi:hypothetical protein